MSWFDRPIIVIDVETSGLDPVANQIVQLSAIYVSCDSQDDPVTFNQYVRLDGPMGVEAWAVHRIPHTILQNALEMQKVIEAFNTFVGYDNNIILAGHHVSFDEKFLRAAYNKCGVYPFPFDRHMIDLWAIAVAYLNAKKGEINHYSLQNLCDYIGLSRRPDHDSMEDAWLTLTLLRRFMRAIAEGVDPRNDV